LSSRRILGPALRRLKRALVRALEASARRDALLALPLARVLALGRDPRFHRPARVPLAWLDEAVRDPRTTVQPPSEGGSYGPTIRGRQQVERLDFPGLARYEFSDARVNAGSSSILLPGRLIVERVPGVDVSRCNYAAGHLLAHGLRTAIVASGSEQHVESGVFLGGNGAFNYYHWLVELLPKLEFVNEDDAPLLVSDDVERIATFREALRRVAGARKVVFLRQDLTYRVSRLIYIESPSICPFNLRSGEEFRVQDFIVRAASIQFLRDHILGSSPPHVSTRRRLFLARKSARRDYNQDEIFAVCRRYGFDKVYMEDMSLQEQIEAIRSAEMIAGPTGAAWTNLIFVEPGTRCLCWMAEEQRGFAAYSNLARAVGAELRYVTYVTGVSDSDRLYFLNYRLDPADVERGLEDLS
jgi:hypothetical protein